MYPDIKLNGNKLTKADRSGFLSEFRDNSRLIKTKYLLIRN